MTLSEAVVAMKERGAMVRRPRWKRMLWIFWSAKHERFMYQLTSGKVLPLPFFHYGWEAVTDFEEAFK